MDFFKDIVLNNTGAVLLGSILLVWKFGPLLFGKITKDIDKVKKESDKADEELKASIDRRFTNLKAEFKEWAAETKEGIKKEREIARDMVKDVWPDVKKSTEMGWQNKVDLAEHKSLMYKELYEKEQKNVK